MQSAQDTIVVPGWGASVNGERTIAAVDADDALIARFLAGHVSAFDSLFAKYQEYVYNIVYGIVGSADDARDVSQEVFVQVYRSLPSFRRGSRFATWLYRIAVNRAVDSARAAKGRRWLPLLETLRAAPDPDADPSRKAEQGAERNEIHIVLQKVPVQHRDVLVLKYFQDLSVEEIAEVLGISVTAAKVRLHRARHHFKEMYVATTGKEGDRENPLS